MATITATPMPTDDNFIISILRCKFGFEVPASIGASRPNAVGFIETIISTNIPTMSGAELFTL
jgi:hypothetical protein